MEHISTSPKDIFTKEDVKTSAGILTWQMIHLLIPTKGYITRTSIGSAQMKLFFVAGFNTFNVTLYAPITFDSQTILWIRLSTTEK